MEVLSILVSRTKTPVPPRWTEEIYELNTRDVLLVLLVFCGMTMGLGVTLWFVH